MAKHALLLVNLGSPESPTVSAVRSFVDQFLMDPYVLDVPWVLRRALVWIILAGRPAVTTRAYESIWLPEGSPLVVLSRRLQAALQAHWQHGPVVLAMRYGEPCIEAGLLELRRAGVSEVTLAPLYPQFAESTTTTVQKEVERVAKKFNLDFSWRCLPAFFEQPVYIHALVNSAKDVLRSGFDHVLFSFHGLPERHLRKLLKGDAERVLKAKHSREAGARLLKVCYRSQCLRTAELFAAQAGLEDGEWSVSFQSRLGKARWIEPCTQAHLVELAERGVRRLVVMCPSFVVDCLESLEEVGGRGREVFLAAGGESFELVPCLNDSPSWGAALGQLCQADLTQVFKI